MKALHMRILSNYLGKNFSNNLDFKSPGVYHRNDISLVSRKGKNVFVVKTYNDPRSFVVDSEIYRLLAETKVLTTPELYHTDEASGTCIFEAGVSINSKAFNVPEVLDDWFRAHQSLRNNVLFRELVERGIVARREENYHLKKLKEIAVLCNDDPLYKDAFKIAKELSIEDSIKLSFIHNDLYRNNMVRLRSGKKAYIDFEFSRLGEVAELLPLVIYNNYLPLDILKKEFIENLGKHCFNRNPEKEWDKVRVYALVKILGICMAFDNLSNPVIASMNPEHRMWFLERGKRSLELLIT